MNKTVSYYLMRHALYYHDDDQFVTYQGMLQLKESLDKLRAELDVDFSSVGIRITHSTLPRAVYTARIAKKIFGMEGVHARLIADNRLNSDRALITQNYIQEVISSCEKTKGICLIISHQRDIRYFSKKYLGYSEYIRMEVELSEDQTQKTDDVPSF